MRKPPYNLLIATGQSPQVVTETVFELNRAEDLQPAAVHVVTTRVGRAYGRAQLLGEPQSDPARGTPIEGVEARWPAFCEEVLGRSPESGEAPVDLTFHVPEVGAEGLEDIQHQGDDTRFANLCYELVEHLTREDQLALIGSIAGGRKTMSAHLMTAFTVYGRPDDRLTHVLLSDPSLEGDPSFFYPEQGSPRYGQLLDLVDIRFPRLRALLEEDLIEGLPDDRQDLEAILDALDPHIAGTRTVSRVEVQLKDGGAQVTFEGAGGTLDACTLRPKQAATLLVFAERRAALGEPVPSTDLTHESSSSNGSGDSSGSGDSNGSGDSGGSGASDEPGVSDEPGGSSIPEQRRAVQHLCSQTGKLDPWEETNDVSKDISRLRDPLRETPIASRLLKIEGLSRKPRRYDWPGEAPELQVTSRYPGESWPFEHIGPLEHPEKSGD
jgi:CRISPR-associated protein (TIGR02584 family)